MLAESAKGKAQHYSFYPKKAKADHASGSPRDQLDSTREGKLTRVPECRQRRVNATIEYGDPCDEPCKGREASRSLVTLVVDQVEEPGRGDCDAENRE